MTQEIEAPRLSDYLTPSWRRANKERGAVIPQENVDGVLYKERDHIRFFLHRIKPLIQVLIALIILAGSLAFAGWLLRFLAIRMLNGFTVSFHVLVVNGWHILASMVGPWLLLVVIAALVVLGVIIAWRLLGAFVLWRGSYTLLSEKVVLRHEPSSLLFGLKGLNDSFDANQVVGAELERDYTALYLFLRTTATISIDRKAVEGKHSFVVKNARYPERLLAAAQQLASQNNVE